MVESKIKINSKILQPKDIFKSLNIAETDEAHKILSAAYLFLIYLNNGDMLKTNDVTFTKISNDVIHVDSTLNISSVIDAFNKKLILQLPI